MRKLFKKILKLNMSPEQMRTIKVKNKFNEMNKMLNPYWTENETN